MDTDEETSSDEGRKSAASRRSVTPQMVVAVAVAAAALMAGAGVGYYFVVEKPRVDRDALEAINPGQVSSPSGPSIPTGSSPIERAEEALAEEAQRATVAAAEERRANERTQARKVAYERCKAVALSNYDADWKAACAGFIETAVANYEECVAEGRLPEDSCRLVGQPRPVDGFCTLPRGAADPIERRLTEARARCLQESEAGLLD